DFLNLRKGGTYVDATVGPGGHSEALLSHLGPEGHLICMDRDEETLELARERLQDKRARFVHARFSELARVLGEMDIQGVDGVLMDFGVSMLQLKTPERGFSFTSNETLDMRMDRSEPTSALEAVNKWPEKELARVIYEYGGEWRSRRIASAICRARGKARIETGLELAEIVSSAVGRSGKTHPATRTFQGLRIAVNREMEEIDAGLEAAVDALVPGGRLVTIAYHSLEDGKAKRFMREAARAERVKLLTKKPLVPTREETRENPSARSAKMRAVEAI
ncbi:MAG: 16S rRNA (cytosine(1402)-N(4))-methyltransferase RsmH, partial [Thermodesulfovibrionales bacterium]|nr:16S rRNA (cytosine(1402)-N(4))-methyltransferase RsmH [Thermodesulfovibrionales bacterium]